MPMSRTKHASRMTNQELILRRNLKICTAEPLWVEKQICGYRQVGASNLHTLGEGASLFAGGRPSRSAGFYRAA